MTELERRRRRNTSESSEMNTSPDKGIARQKPAVESKGLWNWWLLGGGALSFKPVAIPNLWCGSTWWRRAKASHGLYYKKQVVNGCHYNQVRWKRNKMDSQDVDEAEFQSRWSKWRTLLGVFAFWQLHTQSGDRLHNTPSIHTEVLRMTWRVFPRALLDQWNVSTNTEEYEH